MHREAMDHVAALDAENVVLPVPALAEVCSGSRAARRRSP